MNSGPYPLQSTYGPSIVSDDNYHAGIILGSGNESLLNVAIRKLGQTFDLRTRIDWMRLGIKSVLLILFLSYSAKQSIDLLIMYYSNSVEINLEISRPENLTLPAVSLCFVYHHRFSNQPITVADYLNQTPSYSQLVKSCSVLHPTTFEPVDCSNLTNVRTVINRKYKCFSLFRSNAIVDGKGPLVYPLKSIKSFEWLNIKLHKLALVADVVGIAVHNNSDIVHPDLSDQSYMEVIRYWYDDGRVSRVTFTYSASALVLLPEPFTSKCIDYTRLQVPPGPDSRIPLVTESHKNLFESCIAQKYEANHSGYFPMTVFADESYESFKANYKSDSRDMSREDYAVREKVKCRQEYPFPQCYSVNYAVKIKTTAYDNSPEDMEIVMYPPTGNQINLIEVPRHEFREMIAMISGIFSFWIGISVVSIVTPLVPLLISLCSPSKSSGESDPLTQEQIWTRRAPVSGTTTSQRTKNRSSSRILILPTYTHTSSQADGSTTTQRQDASWMQKHKVDSYPSLKSWHSRNQKRHHVVPPNKTTFRF